MAFVSEILKRLNIKIKVLSHEEKEEYGLGMAMEEGMQTKSVSRDTVFKHLRK